MKRKTGIKTRSGKGGAAGTAARWAAAAAAVMAVLLYVPTPYVVYEPGVALPVSRLVEVGTPAEEEAGSGFGEERHAGGWTMTTVYMASRTNYWTVLQAALREDRETHTRRSVLGDVSSAEYAARMNVLMEGSQSSAVEAAYRAAGIPYEIVPKALDVARGAGLLRTGDRILSASGRPVDGAASLLAAVKEAEGDALELIVRRSGEEVGVRVELEPGAAAANAGGLSALLGGASLSELRAIRPDDPAHIAAVRPGSVGGPSAGLAFALYIYDALTTGDLTGGRRIAATGAIDPAGKVTAVGGVGMKTIAAERAGAELFLVPERNEAEARAKAKAAGSGIAVEGVGSLREAVALLTAPD